MDGKICITNTIITKNEKRMKPEKGAALIIIIFQSGYKQAKSFAACKDQ